MGRTSVPVLFGLFQQVDPARRDPEGLGVSAVHLVALQSPRLQQPSYGRLVAGCADVHPRGCRGGRGGYDRDARRALGVRKPVLLHGLLRQGPQQTPSVDRPALFFGHNRLLALVAIFASFLRYQACRTGAIGLVHPSSERFRILRTSPVGCSPKVLIRQPMWKKSPQKSLM